MSCTGSTGEAYNQPAAPSSHSDETDALISIRGPSDIPITRHISSSSNKKDSDDVNYGKGNYTDSLPSFIRGYIGSALLAMPFAFYLVGISWGLVLTVLCCISNHYVMQLIVDVCDDLNIARNAWARMCYRVSGTKLKLVAELALLLSQLGMCIGETIFALRFLNYIFCKLEITSLCEAHSVHVLMILVIIVPLTAVTNMYFLSIPNEIAEYLVISFMTFTIIIGFGQFNDFSHFWTNAKRAFLDVHFDKSLLFCGTLLYTIGGVGAILDVRSSMANKAHFHKVLRDGMIVVGTVHAVFGVFGYTVQLEETREIYLYNLPLSTVSLVFQALYLLTIPMTYIVNQLPLLNIIESWVDPAGTLYLPNGTNGGKALKVSRYMVRYLIVGLIVSIATLAPSFDLFLSFVGSFNFAIMNGAIPVLAYTIQFKGRSSTRQKLLNGLMLTVALVVGVTGMVQTIQGMMQIEEEHISIVRIIHLK